MKHEHMAAWKPEEDQVILALYAKEGRKWGRIASALPGRTSASVRNRYLRIEKGQQLRQAGLSKNRCAACGQQKIGHVCPVKLSITYNEQLLAQYQQQQQVQQHAQQQRAAQAGAAFAHASLLSPEQQYLATPTTPLGAAAYRHISMATPMADPYAQQSWLGEAPASSPYLMPADAQQMLQTVTAQAIAVTQAMPEQPKLKTAFHFPLKKRTSVPGLCRLASAG